MTQDDCDKLHTVIALYSAMLVETTDPIGRLLLGEILAELEAAEREFSHSAGDAPPATSGISSKKPPAAG